jgi:hypothetical protein
MGLWRNIRCSMGSHDWTDWSYVHPGEKRDCTQQQRCRGCEKQETRMWHTLLDWRYARDSGDCVKIRSCSRCLQAVQHKVEHVPGQWRVEGSPCRSVSPCSRCGTIEERFKHSFGKWEYDGPKSCNQLCLCSRCGERDEKPAKDDTDHERWTEWEYQHPFHCELFKRHCVRCEEKQADRKPPRHDWTEWEPVSSTKRRRTCKRCNMPDSERIREG